MLKIVLNCIMYLCAIYGIGENIRRNPKIDAFLGTLEGGYMRINGYLEHASVRSGLEVMRKIYGWACVTMFGLFTALAYLLPHWHGAMLVVSQTFMLTFLSWMSIKWAVDHKATLAEHWKISALLLFCPIIMALCDTFLGSDFTRSLATPLMKLPFLAALQIAEQPHLIIGACFSVVLLLGFLSYYLMTWIITTPVFILSVLAIAIPIQFARLVAAIDREKPFLWLVVFTGGVCALWLTQL